MRMIIVTGMSGAGITTALKYLEDEGFFCIDNLPIPLMGRLADLASELRKAGRDKIALGLDARSGDYLEEMEASLDILKEVFPLEILFMDAQDSTLVRRYKETRRGHPMAPHARVEEGIALERQKMAYLRKKATYILDTSRLLTRELRQE
ncbi:MAG: RNase adaptor protein RapZ, partial [Blautia sp.]|nr:RNase adaptor protein RapZ [Blautia sp.]